MFDDRDFTMDVQVGPETEITASVGETPVDIAKKNPGTVCVAGKHKEDGVCEFFVEFDDVANFAELNEMCLIDALDAIVAYHEDTNAGMTRDNLIMIVDEDSMEYVEELEAYGATCMRIVTEADEISMDVQVGPEGDEIRMSEDPQDANPVDAVKRQYGNVVIAKQGDEFFTDVEDVQKCAELNCESVIDTLNGIIAANEDCGVNTDNLVVIVDESVSDEVYDTLDEAGVKVSIDNIRNKRNTKKSRKSLMKLFAKEINNFFKDNSARSASVMALYWIIDKTNNQFINDKSNTMHFRVSETAGQKIGVGSYGGTYGSGSGTYTSVDRNAMHEAIDRDIKIFRKNANKIKKDLEDAGGVKISSIEIDRDADISITIA